MKLTRWQRFQRRCARRTQKLEQLSKRYTLKGWSLCITVLGRPLRFSHRAVIWAVQLLLRYYVYYFVAIDHKAKCPGCGVRKWHEIRWSAEHEHEIHQCTDCKAVWGERPLRSIEDWRVQLEPQSVETDILTTVQGVQREPKIVPIERAH